MYFVFTRTEQAYLDWIHHFILFHAKRHPAEMGQKGARLN
ncbi:phage integrase N-terminal SAM-like domain-containing protein [Candidatus Thiosymbion oneisti]|nr:phage integrase N-terminal SAM-like domain-containing protein [Candidatus Thiosymbion oneisti]